MFIINYLKSVSMLNDFRTLKTGTIFDFTDGLNVIVGDNGTGKSSFFQMITSKNLFPNKVKNTLYKLNMSSAKLDKPMFRYFDSEKHNLRLQAEFGDNIEAQVAMMYSSHGLAQLAVMESMKHFESDIVLIDEPEAGVSLKNIKNLIEYLQETAKKNQVIISTHHPYLIETVNTVYSTDSFKRIKTKNFLSQILKK